LKFTKSESERFFVAAIGGDPQLLAKAISVAAELRGSGLSVQSDITGRSLRKTLEAQSAAGTKAVVIIGERELLSGTVKVRWMSSGEEETVQLNSLRERLSRS